MLDPKALNSTFAATSLWMLGRLDFRSRYLLVKPTIFLLLGGIVIPNIFSAIAGIWIGTPTRSISVGAYAAAALLCTKLSKNFLVAMYVAIMSADAIAIISHLIFLKFSSNEQMNSKFSFLELLISPLHIAVIAVMLLLLLVNVLFVLHHKTLIAKGNKIVFIAVVLAYIISDIQFNS